MAILKLAAATGIAPHRLEAAWTVSEFAELMAMREFDPVGQDRDDLHTALLATVIVAAMTGKAPDPLKFNLGYLLEESRKMRQIASGKLSAAQDALQAQHAAAFSAWGAVLPKESHPAAPPQS